MKPLLRSACMLVAQALAAAQAVQEAPPGPEQLAELARQAEDSADRELSAQAVRALYRLRIRDADLPAVLALLRGADTRTARWVAFAASTAREAGARALLDELGSGDGARVLLALRAARAFPPERALLVPAIRPFLADADPATRYWACFALGALVPDSLPAVFEACEHDDPRVRLCAVEILEKTIRTEWLDPESAKLAGDPSEHGLALGDDPRRASQPLLEQHGVPRLAARLADPDEEVRVLAALALAKLGPRAAHAREALLRAREDASPFVRFWTERALALLEPAPPRARLLELQQTLLTGPPAPVVGTWIEQIAKELDDPDVWDPKPAPTLEKPMERDRRFEAASFLVRHALQELLARERGGSADEARRAGELLTKMERNLDVRVRMLVRQLDDESSVGDRYGGELAALGTLVLPELAHELLRNPRFPIGEPTYAELGWVLEQLGDAALPVLTEGLEHWNTWGTAWSAQALFKLRERALPALPAVISAWRCAGDDQLPGIGAHWDSTDDLSRVSGTTHRSREWTFGRTDPVGVARMGPDAVPWLARALGDEHALVRERAARALGSLGEPARDALAALELLLGDREERVRSAAARAILTISGARADVRTRAWDLCGGQREEVADPADPKHVRSLVEALEDTDAERRAQARSELVRSGAAAVPVLKERYRELLRVFEPEDVPHLIGVLDAMTELAPDHVALWPFLAGAEDPHERQPLNLWLSVRQVVDSEDWEELDAAIHRALGATGPRHLAQLARTRVHAEWEESDSARCVINDFRMRPEDVPALFPLVRQADTRVARWMAFGAFDARDGGARAIIDELASGDAERIVTALQVARAFPAEQDLLVPTIRPLLAHADPATRYWACFALGSMVPASLPVLFEAFENEDSRVRLCAVEVVEKTIWPWLDYAPEHAVHYEQRGEHFDWHASWPGSFSRSQAQPLIEQEGVALLAARLSDTDEEVRTIAALALTKLGAKAAGAREDLRRASGDDSYFVRAWAERALAQLEPGRPHERLQRLSELLLDGKPSRSLEEAQLEAAVRDLDHPDLWEPAPEYPTTIGRPEAPDPRWEAVCLLARSALPALLELEQSGTPSEAERAALVLSKMEREFDARVGKLIRLLDDEFGAGGRAGQELAWLGPLVLPELAHDLLRKPRFPIGDSTYDELSWVLEQLGEPALPVLTVGLAHWNEWGRWSAEVLVELGEDASPALPAVVSAWRCAGDDPRVPGVDTWLTPAAVARIGPGTVPWLTRVLGDEHAPVRERAARTLAHLGEPARAAVGSLSTLLDDREEPVRRAAAQAILDLGGGDEALQARARALIERD